MVPRSFGESWLALRGGLGLLSGVGSPFCHSPPRSLLCLPPVRAPLDIHGARAGTPTLLLTRRSLANPLLSACCVRPALGTGGTMPSKDVAQGSLYLPGPPGLMALEPDSFTSP